MALRLLRPAAVAAALFAAGCGSIAWQATPEVPSHAALAAPMQIGSFAGAVKSTTAIAEGVVPRLEFFAGAALLPMGDKYAGTDGAGTPALVTWSNMFERGFGIDFQFVLRRPQQPASAMSTGDTFAVVRGTLETYNGKAYSLDSAIFTPDGLTLIGGWLEGRTLLNAFDAGNSIRPYLQYGGGVMNYTEVTVNGAHWDSTIALGWRMALGVEMRKGRLGLYGEGGIQVVGPPDVAENTVNDAARVAQDLVTYPIRFGVMVGF